MSSLKKCKNWPIGICTWSLKMEIDEAADIISLLGINYVHLALLPAIQGNGYNYLSVVNDHNWKISSTMINFPQEDYSSLDSIRQTGGIIPDEYWAENHNLILQSIDLTEALRAKYLSMHAGFLDHSDPENKNKFYERINLIADEAESKNVTFLIETGQESADDLKTFLETLDHPNIGINYDPANMILYNKDNPLDSLKILAPWIKHIHIKDAIRTKNEGEWGEEVVWGNGEVGGKKFIDALNKINYQGSLAIEREAGDSRAEDIKLAIDTLSNY